MLTPTTVLRFSMLLSRLALLAALWLGSPAAPGAPAATAATAAAAERAAPLPAACIDASVFVLTDVTQSFVEHLLHKDLFRAAVGRIRSEFPHPLCIGSEVTLALIGQSHAGVGGSYQHLESKHYRITRNHITADNVADWVARQLDVLHRRLASGALQAQRNTALVMAFDNVADLARLRGKPAYIFAISDGEETELDRVMPMVQAQGLAGARVFLLGAGVTLAAGTPGQRRLRADWERYFRLAGAAQFHWLSKP